MSDDFFGAADARRDQFHADLDAREAAARARLGAGPGIDLSGNQIDTAPNGSVGSSSDAIIRRGVIVIDGVGYETGVHTDGSLVALE